jgi:hypothetical protein
MKKYPTAVCLALLAILASTSALAQAPAKKKSGKPVATGAKKLYCWDEGGKRVCGDALPATAVDNARTEISARSGLPTGRVDRALTPAERDAAQRQAVLAEQAALAVSAQRMREMAMAESYDTEADLRRAFGNRIALLDDTIKAAQLNIGSLRLSLVSLLRQAGEAELSGKPVQAALTTTIRSQHGQLLRQQTLLAQHRRNRSEIDKDLSSALERYRELKSEAAGGSRDG